MTLSINEIAQCIGTRIPQGAGSRIISTLIIDSRSLIRPEEAAFMALRTPTRDGHAFIQQAYLQGIRTFIVEQVPDGAENWPDAVFLTVDSVPKALQALGAEARRRFQGKVVAITGSRGKTTFKEMLYRMTTAAGVAAVRSPRSWNSQIGVPLALWQLPQDGSSNQLAIIEVGIDRAGEMQALADIVKPDFGVITCLTDEHDAGFESREQKLTEKLRLFDQTEAVLVAHDPTGDLAAEASAIYPDKNILSEGQSNSYSDNYANACRRLAQAMHLPDISEGDTYNNINVDTRIDVYDGANGCLLVCDTFTCDLQSLREVLDFTRRRRDPRPAALILGNLLAPYGTSPAEIYAQAARILEDYGIRRLYIVGDAIKDHADAFNPAMIAGAFSSIDDFNAAVSDDNFDNELIIVKGDTDFRSIVSRLQSPRHDTNLEVNLNSLVHNFNHYRAMLRPTTGIICMVKAGAYGMGAVEVAKTLQAQGASYLAVAVVDEGVDLRRAGITMPILVLNPVTSNYRSLFRYNLQPAVFSPEELSRLSIEAQNYGVENYPVHIKFDTGMHRVGFTEAEIPGLINHLTSHSTLRAASAFSHLATADCLDMDDYTQLQFTAFERMTQALAQGLPYPIMRHILNTAGIQRYPEKQYDMVRLGVGLYGIDPLGIDTGRTLRTVATLTSTIISLKHWPAGTTIGYGRRGRLERDSIIATIPIGYADGLDRHLGRGNTSMLVRGHLCPTVGNICMDLCMIDVTDANAQIGDRVEIFGPGVSIEDVARSRDTIPYEILTSVSPRVKRIYYNE